MNWAWKIGTAFGIPVRLHVSMLLIPFIAFSWVPGSGPLSLVTAAALVILLFGSVLLHELGHALTARRFGVRTADIILTPLGGMARLIDLPRRPRHEIAIAIAGPLVSLAIAGAAFVSIIPLQLVPVVPDVVLVGLAVLFELNLMLGLFNLVPALPMDGGRILRGALALRLDFLKATRIAARIGRVIAVVGGVLAVFYFKSWSLALIAVFVYFSAGMEERVAEWREAQRRGAAGAPWPFGAGPRVRTWTWGGRPGATTGGGPEPTWRATGPVAGYRPPAERDVVVIEGGKAEIISRKDPDKT